MVRVTVNVLPNRVLARVSCLQDDYVLTGTAAFLSAGFRIDGINPALACCGIGCAYGQHWTSPCVVNENEIKSVRFMPAGALQVFARVDASHYDLALERTLRWCALVVANNTSCWFIREMPLVPRVTDTGALPLPVALGSGGSSGGGARRTCRAA